MKNRKSVYMKAWRIANRKKIKAYMRTWHKENKEQEKEYRKKNKEKIGERNKAWREKNRVKYLTYHKKYRKINAAMKCAHAANRHAKKLQATPKWTTRDDYKRISGIYLAAKELKLLAGCKLEVDHIIPLQGREVCGLHVFWNLQLLTEEESAKKGNELDVN